MYILTKMSILNGISYKALGLYTCTVHKANTDFFYTKGAMVQELIMDSNNNR